jgi:AcrR family transcriptional regulator
MVRSSLPIELPIVSAERHERADAARNRERILAAAERLFEREGVSCTSMDAIAAEAGVGKGTLFRRFGDRGSLALALLDRAERALQDAVLSGPPPLGPGAPAPERLVAFGCALLDRLQLHGDLLIAAEATGYLQSAPHAVHWLHIRSLVRQAWPDCDLDYVTDVLLSSLSARTFAHQRHDRQMELDRLKAGFAHLVERLLPGCDTSPAVGPGPGAGALASSVR